MTLNWQDRYQARREPERTLRLMSPGDVAGAVAVSQSAGWPHTADDWERFLHWSPDGCFVIEEAERGIIATCTTVTYGAKLAWIGMMVVVPDRQRRGLGRQLMRAVLDHLIARGVERIMLDASEDGRPLYESLEFRGLCKIERWEGRASTYLGPRGRRLEPGDTAALLALDEQLSGLKRAHILLRLLGDYPQMAWVDWQHGELQGFLLGHPLSTGQIHLGPWMAWSSASAQRLLRVAFEDLQGSEVCVRIPDYNGRSLVLASDHNLRRTWHTLRMIFRDAQPVAGEPLAELGIVSSATG